MQYSTRIDKALEFAKQFAQGYGHEYVGPEHILLGILKGNGVGRYQLNRLGLDLSKARESFESLLGNHRDDIDNARIELMDAAGSISSKLGFDYIATEHVVYALIAKSPKGSIESEILGRHNISINSLDSKVRAVLQD